MKKLSKKEKKMITAGRFCIVGLPKRKGLFCWD
ncbi:hypothetical protein SPSF3K_00471 [Streptococcus parauberis]|nr:hypothetical protein SPSF3K_00471 [Streptococcus parauberis]KYP17073.1 hypothetical protein TN39_01986 [Streptococcus parauberis]KYP17293.1 hypothetical protein AKL14_01717 [Streptococcus parauberis]KYP17306.1 hypothetical protein AKL13_01976 [Streptococcus parauberis]KYP23983.1 hypothetical protein TP84_01978 [Streptococcus parauberis]